MKFYAEMVITPLELKNCTMIQKDIMIQRANNVLITGTVLDIQCRPVQKAVISIIQINDNYQIPKMKELGYAITNQDGTFAVLIEKHDYIDYRLDIYKPMII